MDLFFFLQLWRQINQLRQHEHWTRQQLTAYQERSLDSLRKYAYTHSSFYQRFHKGLEARPLQDLPVLTKAHVMEHFDELVTDSSVHLTDVEAHLATLKGDGRFRGRYWVNATSGTTGRRGLFLFNRSEWLTILAVYARTHDWTGIRIGLSHNMSLASVASTAPWHMSARISATLQSRWAPALRLDASDPVNTIVERLNDWQPEMFVTYPSVARILAIEQYAGRLHISPRIIWTGAEVLTDETRHLIKTAWNKKPFNQYAATESGGIAAECEEHIGMHVMEDMLLIEVVDMKNRPVPPGVYGDKLLITVLFNRTQPLIRYEITDSVRLSDKPCPCGRPYILLDGVQGRVEEILYLSSPAGDKIAIHPNVFHRIIDTVPSTGWQVIQEPGKLRILLTGVSEAFSNTTLVRSIEQELKTHGVVIPAVQIERVSSIPRGATGKAPLIKAIANK